MVDLVNPTHACSCNTEYVWLQNVSYMYIRGSKSRECMKLHDFVLISNLQIYTAKAAQQLDMGTVRCCIIVVPRLAVTHFSAS